jgi:hypothetical protein
VKKAPAYNNRRMKKRSRMEGARDGRSAAHTQP